MSYSIETYDKAQNILDRRKEKATLEAQSRIDKLCAEIPELNVINRKLAQIGLNISRTFFTSKDPQADINKLRIESLALQEEKKNLLKKNGYDENELAIKYTCTACEDTGFINGRRCKCFVNLLKEIERDKIEKIAPIEECTFDTFSTEYYPDIAQNGGISPKYRAEKIKESCIGYATNFSKGAKNLLFTGGTGLGKTHLSLAIANVVINRGYSVIYGTAQNILGDLQNENFGRIDNLKYRENEILDVDLLILDEPINGLDPQGIVEVRETIQKLAKERGMTICISSHILEELSKLATDYGIIHNGCLVQELTREELMKKCSERIELTLDNPKQAIAVLDDMGFSSYQVIDKEHIHIFERLGESARLNMELAKAGIPVKGISITSEELENYFLRLTGGDNRA